MWHRARFAFLLLLSGWIVGCQSTREFNYLVSETLDFRDKKITSIVTKKGDVIYYDIAGARYVVDVKDTTMERKVIGFSIENKPTSTPLENILEINCESRETDGAGTGLAVLAGAGVVLLVLFAIFLATFRIH